MRVIVKNKTLDLYRKNKKINMVEIHDGLFNDEEQESFYDMFINDIPTLIESLSPQYKKVVTLYYLEEKSHNEISEILGISVSSSKTNLLRSKIKMKKTLSKLYPSI
jgi:RNA polymerase sigma-70 factor (ECF subfamily)